ncbi:MAG: FAD-binding oxidoreductase [Salinarimonadaceae bacterium]|nr:MAG: FAD-binding oxidoreductase [Salinarimonadaceae bacterium]
MNADVIVLGAGMIGVSIALHLQRRGRDVVLLDRRGAGEETSYGNAGIVERASVTPYPFPRDLASLVKYGLNRSTQVRYDPFFLPRIAPWLFSYWRASSPARLAEARQAMKPLIEACVDEHADLIAEAGAAPLIRRNGWIKAVRSQKSLDAEAANAEELKAHGIAFEILDRAALAAREPHLGETLIGGVHFTDPPTSPDPGGLTKAYADLFVRKGGRFVEGDARTLAKAPQGWRASAADGSEISAREAVIALGPWSNDVYEAFGYRMPLAVKRGYHMHYRARGNAVLSHPVLDVDTGVVLAPMSRGVRMTTGVEFAARDAPANTIQIGRCEPFAREIFPLGERIETTPWLGCRPCLPDMRPVIGPAPRHPGLWFAFGHNHHGFTLGPVTGRLLAQMMTGAPTLTDPTPYRADRF